MRELTVEKRKFEYKVCRLQTSIDNSCLFLVLSSASQFVSVPFNPGLALWAEVNAIKLSRNKLIYNTLQMTSEVGDNVLSHFYKHATRWGHSQCIISQMIILNLMALGLR